MAIESETCSIQAPAGGAAIAGFRRCSRSIFQTVGVASVCIAGISGGSASAQSTDAPTTTRLLLDSDVAASMSAGDAHRFSSTLPPGRYLLTVDQRGLDLAVHLTAPEQHVYNSPTFRDDRETVLLTAESETNFEFSIESDEYTDAIGGYSVGIRALDDAREIEGYGLMTEAAEIYQTGPDENWARALEVYETALAVWEATRNIREQARTKLAIAQSNYYYGSLWQEAIDAAADAAVLYQAVDNEPLYANSLHLQATALIEAASEADSGADSDSAANADDLNDAALDLFATALSIQEAHGQWYDRAQTLNNIGLTYHNRAEFAQASRHYQEAADEFRRLEEYGAEMNPLANLAVIDYQSDQLIKAKTTLTRLLELMPAEEDPWWRADTLDNLATAQYFLGNADMALLHYLDALKLHEELNDVTGRGRSLAGIGATYRLIGELDLAREFLERALPLRREAADGRGQVAVLRALAEIDLSENRLVDAGDHLRQASRLATSPLALAGVKVRQGEAWIAGGEHSRAQAALDEARELAESIGASGVYADAVYWTGRLFEEAGQSDEGAKWFGESLAEFERLGIRSGKAKSLVALARTHRSTDLELAVDFAKLAVEEVEALRSGVGDPELRAVFLASRADYYELLIDMLMDAASRTSTTEDAEGYIRDALEVSERAKARSTVDLLNEAAVDLAASIDPDIRLRLSTLTERLAERQYQRNKLLESGTDSGRIAPIVAEIGSIRAEIDVLEAESRQRNPVYASMSKPQVLTAAQIQGAIGRNAVLLQYWLGDSASYLWAVTGETVQGYRLPARARIDSIARQAYEGLSRSGAAGALMDLAGLSNTLLAPANVQIANATTIVVAADGALQYLPFAALPALGGSGRLIDSHRVVSVPSMTVIDNLSRARGDRPAPTRTLAAIGDPVFSARDPRYSQASFNVVPADSRSGAADGEFDRLPFSGMEVERIAALVPEAARFVATGLDANAALLTGGRLTDFRYVHLATHGIIDATEPDLSSLVFSRWDHTGSAREPFMRLRDIYNLDLDADVVVLSACETALGREIRGEGLIGLTQGFFYAGTEGVVASLWKVSDRATSELMVRFYSNMLSEGQAPAEALRNAQVVLANNRRWRDPYFWSGFVYQGNWSD